MNDQCPHIPRRSQITNYTVTLIATGGYVYTYIYVRDTVTLIWHSRGWVWIRPLFVGFMFFIRKFPGWYAGGRVITIIHYTHFKFLLSKFSQIMAKIIIMNVGIDKTFLKFKFSQEIINNGEKCG